MFESICAFAMRLAVACVFSQGSLLSLDFLETIRELSAFLPH